eukprot:gene8467-8651_t
MANMPQMYNTNPIPLHHIPTDGVVKGSRTSATPRLSPERVLQRLAETKTGTALRHFGAFYSSELGGIVTEPGFMVVGVDDHIVHKADAVSEEVPLVDGYLYQFDEHLERFATSADMAGLPWNMPEARLRRILLDTAAASLKMNGTLYFWLSRGRGTTGLCDTSSPSFYALLTSETSYLDVDRDNGYRAVTTPVEPKPMYFKVMQNTNWLQSSVAKLEAMSKGADLAVFVDADGTVLYGQDCSIALMTQDKVLVIPPDESGLCGMAAHNVAQLALQYKDTDLTVEAIERRLFTVGEMLTAQEAFAINTRAGVVGISHFDDKWIGKHEFLEQAGPLSLALNEMLNVDRQYVAGSSRHTEVPYGYMSGMLSQLH